MARRGAKQRSRTAAQPSHDEPPVVGFVSLGCAKNLVDSEKMLGQIAESGAILTGDETAADTIVVNTCGFLDAARQEALQVLRELGHRKQAGELRRIVVAGCLVQRDNRHLLDSIPEIDAIVGVNNRDDVVGAVWGRAAARQPARDVDCYLGDYHPGSAAQWTDRGRLRLTPPHYAYVRISEGCNQKCTFCTIPSIRGPMHSKPLVELTRECRELIDDGARELILIGQDTTSYGVDRDVEPDLAGLLRELDRSCDGADWLRLMYVYPSVFTDAMIDAIAECDRVVKYIDIPLQHINDRVLRAMGRRVTRAQTETLLDKLRARIDGVTIRTTFIVGFPGETDAEFDELVTFVRDFGFDAVGAFQYSHEPETPAAKIAGRHDARTCQARYDALMTAQQKIALAAARRCVGTTFDVVVDEAGDESSLIGRHAGQAPEVDSVCLVRGDRFDEGERIAARCVDTDGYDLVVEPAQPRLPVV